MGQVPGSQADEDSCFRACLRQKRQNLGKRPPPPFVSNSQQHIQAANIVRNLKPPDQGTSSTPGHHKNTPHTRAGETSIEDRLEQSMSPERAAIDCLNPAARMSADPGKLHQQSPADEDGILLGLQSKFSSSRRTVIGKTGTTTRITTVSEGLGTRSNWEVGISDQTNTRSHGASTESTKSRNILLNKIEGVKQKYYQRELEIEICQNENEYEDQLEQGGSRSKENIEQSRVKAGESRVKAGEVREESSVREVRDVASVRQKIIQKLNKRKMLKHRKSNKERNQNEQSGATDGAQELQMFSKEGKQVQEEPLDRSNGVLNEDLNQSARSTRNRGDVSIEDRMQFSGYSQQETLHEIRECDEDEEDYKSRVESNRKNSQVRRSKMVPPRFSNLTSLKKSREMGLNVREEGSLGERKEEMAEERKEEMGEERSSVRQVQGRSVVRLQSGTGTKIFVF